MVVTKVAGAVTSEPARLWVVPPAAGFIKRDFTNQFGVRLPYFYLLPTNYTAARRYPLALNFHGVPDDETMITTPNGYANYPRLKVFASYRQQEADIRADSRPSKSVRRRSTSCVVAAADGGLLKPSQRRWLAILGGARRGE